MSRNLSPLGTQAVLAQETGEVFILLLTISHASLAEPIRVACDTQNVVSRGQTFVAFPFGFVLPGDRADQIPTCKLWIDNIDRSIVQSIRKATGSAPTLLGEIVLRSQPDTLEFSFDGYSLKNADYDVLQVAGDLSLEDPLNEPYPADSYTPNLFPAVF